MQAVKHEQETTKEVVPTTERQLSLTEEAEKFVELAEDSDLAAAQQVYRAKAARFYIEAGNLPRAKQQRDIVKQLYEDELARSAKEADTTKVTLSLLSAEIAIAEQNLTLANELIANTKPITRQQQIDYHTAKANLEYLSGNYLLAVDGRVKLGTYLTDPQEKNRNNKKIWAALSNIPTGQLKTQRSSNPVTTAWLDLARVMR